MTEQIYSRSQGIQQDVLVVIDTDRAGYHYEREYSGCDVSYAVHDLLTQIHDDGPCTITVKVNPWQ